MRVLKSRKRPEGRDMYYSTVDEKFIQFEKFMQMFCQKFDDNRPTERQAGLEERR
jgi:hypothetical protein